MNQWIVKDYLHLPYPILYSAGVDFEKAKEKGLKTIWALSLPGKVAPVSAAEFIKDTVFNIIKELGV